MFINIEIFKEVEVKKCSLNTYYYSAYVLHVFQASIHLSIHDIVRVYVLRPPYKCSSYIFNAEIYSDSNLVLLYNGSQDI